MVLRYIDNGKKEYDRYSYSENLNDNVPLMLLSYYNNNQFDLFYDKNIKLNLEGVEKKKNIIINANFLKIWLNT